jgi:hypothetical protein
MLAWVNMPGCQLLLLCPLQLLVPGSHCCCALCSCCCCAVCSVTRTVVISDACPAGQNLCADFNQQDFCSQLSCPQARAQLTLPTLAPSLSLLPANATSPTVLIEASWHPVSSLCPACHQSQLHPHTRRIGPPAALVVLCRLRPWACSLAEGRHVRSCPLPLTTHHSPLPFLAAGQPRPLLCAALPIWPARPDGQLWGHSPGHGSVLLSGSGHPAQHPPGLDR